ncbi:MAG: HAD-IIA family hydrolase [Actinomycetota bacterium]
MAWVLDLDGVVWLEHRALPGAVEAVAHLRELGHRVVFATNFSHGRRDELESALRGVGIDPRDDLCTSAMAAGSLLSAGERVHVLGGPGIVEAAERAGASVVGRGEATDAVIVGWTRAVDFDRLDAAFQAVHAGARLIATNTDRTYPTPNGPIPGGGALVAAVEWATGVDAEVAGKPHRPMADLVEQMIADDPGTPREGSLGAVMVGDRPATDGRFAVTLGLPFALVTGGVTAADDLPTDPPATYVADGLAALVRRWAGPDAGAGAPGGR